VSYGASETSSHSDKHPLDMFVFWRTTQTYDTPVVVLAKPKGVRGVERGRYGRLYIQYRINLIHSRKITPKLTLAPKKTSCATFFSLLRAQTNPRTHMGVGRRRFESGPSIPRPPSLFGLSKVFGERWRCESGKAQDVFIQPVLRAGYNAGICEGIHAIPSSSSWTVWRYRDN
jgi:hypothetical protein